MRGSPRRIRLTQHLSGTTAPTPASAEERDGRDEEPVDGSQQPGGERGVALLLPDPRPRVASDQPRTQPHLGERRCRADVLFRLGGVELDAAETFGTDKAVLARAHQPGRRAMITDGSMIMR
jgi:hypothetical protein